MNRRKYLTTVCASSSVLIAGCSSSTDSGNSEQENPEESPSENEQKEHEYVPDPWTNIEQEEGDTSTTITGEASLQEGQYALRQAKFERPYNVEVSISTQENEIDVLGMSADEFDRYRDRESPVYYDGFYETGISDITISGQLGSGEHRFIFDNSAVFGSKPTGEVTFDFETVVSL